MTTRWSAEDAARAGRALAAKLARKPSPKDNVYSPLERLVINSPGLKTTPATPPDVTHKIVDRGDDVDSSGSKDAGGSAGTHTRAWQIDESGSGETIVPRKRSKYHNVQSGQYDSRKEARRGDELKLMLAHGLITDLEKQRAFVLVPAQHDEHGKCLERAVTYKADFVYRHAGKLIVEDAKSPPTRTEAYVIRRKLMLFVHKIAVVEV